MVVIQLGQVAKFRRARSRRMDYLLAVAGSSISISEKDLPVIQPASPQQTDVVSCGGFVMKNTQQMERWTRENVHRQVSAAIT